jgi:hypothetical protein
MINQNPDLQVQFEEKVSQLLIIIEDMVEAYGLHKDLNRYMPDLIEHFNSVKTIQEKRIIVKTKMHQAILKYLEE